MTQARTPRQTPGNDLVPLTVMIPRPLLEAVEALSVQERRSRSYIGRVAIEAYVQQRNDDASNV